MSVCGKCLYNKNCQFLAKYKIEPDGCTAFRNAEDFVDVVRCFRCRFAVNKKENGEFVTYCALDWGMRGVLDPNDYCSYGKEIKRCQD